MDFRKLVFFCVLHLDTNLGAAWVSLYDDYAKQLAASRHFRYGDPKSPHRRFHGAMDKAGLEPITARLRNRIPPEQQPQEVRLLGPHVIAAMQTIYLFDAALKVDNETEAEWLERSALKKWRWCIAASQRNTASLRCRKATSSPFSRTWGGA